MWVAEFQLSGKNFSVGQLAYKHKVGLRIYPTSFENKGKEFVVNYAILLYGDEKKKSHFLKALGQDKNVVSLSTNLNLVLCQMKQDLMYEAIYNVDLVYLKPWEINMDGKGMEKALIYCWKRDRLSALSKLIRAQPDGKLVKLHKKPLYDFFFVKVQPKVTVKQKRAIDLAIANGYYEYPRKVTLEKLAAMMNVSYSTFQAHLRRAEKKFLPLFREISKEYE